jgi:hypothetical protein
MPYRPFFLEHEEENEAHVAAGVEQRLVQRRVQPERSVGSCWGRQHEGDA